MNPEAPRDGGSVQAAIASACARIAPNWPLDSLIAVNPHWGWIDHPFTDAGVELARLSGSSLWMPRSYYRAAWKDGHIRRAHLQQALHEVAQGERARHYIDWLSGEDRQQAPLPLLSDIADSRRALHREPAWADLLTQQISQFCGAYFDEAQSDWRPEVSQGLYASWRAGVQRDHGIGLLSGEAAVAPRAATLPEQAQAAIAHGLAVLQVAESRHTDLLTALLLRINGWAAWCAYRGWQARLAGREDHTLVELLAIRLGWECLLDDGHRDVDSQWSAWQQAWRRQPAPYGIEESAIWQRALELSYQQTLCAQLVQAVARERRTPRMQAVFCIDVRSEVFRRALESRSPDIQTAGYAGFFGLPVAYQPLATDIARPQLPGLLAPQLLLRDSTGRDDRDAGIAGARTQRLLDFKYWQQFQRQPASGFALVESLGIRYLGKLLARGLGYSDDTPVEAAGLRADERAALVPQLPADCQQMPERVDMAERILRGMALTRDFAPLVLLVGHGARSANNPQLAGLHCGACCGQTGEANARALAVLLNDPIVRQGLAARGIEVPAQTQFVAALHVTTTDEVQLFDVEQAVPAAQAALDWARGVLREAGDRARAERAGNLGMSAEASSPDTLLRSLRRRASDWSQTRPEWGLADNAAFIIAPRRRTRDLNLRGRSFLHEYDSQADADGRLIEQIMTAPMLVTHWINLQYYASTVDNRRYGSGNKLLHNVVGGNIGLFEGNAGDLRIGLPLQSLHDGEQWRHTPLRLSVFIEAPRALIDPVIAGHETVRQLLDHSWVYLYRLDPQRAGVERYTPDGWVPALPASAWSCAA